jgi:UDP-N-acetylglucosamine 2-epimerase
VWGEADKKLLIKWGVKSSRIIVTGSPLYDGFGKSTASLEEKRELFKKLGLNRNKKTVMLATQATEGEFAEEERQRVMEIALNAAREMRDWQLIIKLHPRDNEAAYRLILDRYGLQNAAMVKREYGISELLDIADCVATVHSTVIYDAFIKEKPVIMMDVMNRPDLKNLIKTGAFARVSSKKEFCRALESINNRGFIKKLAKKRKGFIKTHLYGLGGRRASSRIAFLIEKMIKDERIIKDSH